MLLIRIMCSVTTYVLCDGYLGWPWNGLGDVGCAVYLKLAMKKPGLDMETTMSELNLTYKDRYVCLS